ncbi:hypothetical protein [Streptomyces sp. JNUCC 63]
MLLRLACLIVSNAFAALWLLPMSDRAKDAEILALRHQITVLERQLGPKRPWWPAGTGRRRGWRGWRHRPRSGGVGPGEGAVVEEGEDVRAGGVDLDLLTGP